MGTKNAVIAYGSPRLRKSGSYHLGEQFAKGLKKGGFRIDEIMIHEKNIKPCLGCFSCLVKSPGMCVHRDDMDDLLPILDQADLIVYALPLYVYSVTRARSY
jgi:multimeric flavodoxin WrbA